MRRIRLWLATRRHSPKLCRRIGNIHELEVKEEEEEEEEENIQQKARICLFMNAHLMLLLR